MTDPVTDHEARLEAALRDLGASLAVPEPPEAGELTAAVRARLADPPGRSRGPLLGGSVMLRVAAAVVVAVLAFALLLVVSPPVRAGVLNLLRFAGIEFGTDSAPPASTLPTVAPLPGERSVDLATARGLARFQVSVPEALGQPERVLLADGEPPRIVSLLYRGGAIRLDQFDGTADFAYFKKLLGSEGFQWLEVNGRPGVWVNRPHEVVYVDRDGNQRTESARLSATTLIWQVGEVTLRLEGDFTMDEARRIAESVR